MNTLKITTEVWNEQQHHNTDICITSVSYDVSEEAVKALEEYNFVPADAETLGNGAVAKINVEVVKDGNTVSTQYVIDEDVTDISTPGETKYYFKASPLFEKSEEIKKEIYPLL